MTPAFKITADDANITDTIEGRLVSLSLTDEAGFESDSLELVLDNAGLIIEPPRTGVELRVWLGYVETGLTEMGLFVVDEYERSGWPHRLVIRARSAWGGSGKDATATAKGVKTALKEQRSRSFDQVTLASIVETIAAECGLTALVEPSLGAEVVAHVDQANEGNAHFLQRMARDRDAVFKPAGGTLLFVPKGSAKTAMGVVLPKIEVSQSTVLSYRLTVAEREDYQSVEAVWHDGSAAEQKTITAGDGEPVRRLRKVYASPEDAARAATAELRRIGRGAAAPSFSLVGSPAVMAEQIAVVDASMGSDLEGEWLVGRVSHRLDKGGFVTSIECENLEVKA